MKLSLTQLNAILKPCFFIHSKSKQTVCMLFFFFWMLNLNTAWAQGNCPEGEPLQWEWMQDLIASSNGCDIEAIGQFEYEGDTYYHTLKSGCLAENDLLFFNCMGDKVCADSDNYVRNQCNQSIVSASADNTNIIWSYEDTSEPCLEVDPLDRAWMQRLIISSNGCNIESIVQFEYKGKPYYRTTSAGCLSTNKYLYYNCEGEQVCVDPEIGYAFKKCDEEIISANTNNATTIWTYEEPCPEGDPLQWNWIQSLTNNSEECYIEAIIQFEYKGNTFFRTARTNCLLYKRYSFFNCQGQEICVDVTYSTSDQCDDEIISASVENGNIIWTYEDLSPPLNCLEGDPLQWDWVQTLIAGSNGCNVEAIGQFEFEGNTYYRTLDYGCLARNKYLLFNCEGEEVCFDYSLSNNRCNQEIVSASADITSLIWSYEDTNVICPEGDPLEWDWIQDLIAQSNGCNIEAIGQFEKEGNTYFHTLGAGCFENNKFLFFNCEGEEICIDEKIDSYNNCGEETLFASTNSTIIWAYEDTCPEGDPLEWDWMQDLIDSSDGCNIEAIIQFEFNGNTFFRTARVDCLIDQKYLYFNCEGEQLCKETYYEQCGAEIFSISTDNGNIIWTYEDLTPPVTCPEGDPLQWDWMQDLIATSSGCNIGAIHQFEFEGNTYYRTADKEFSCFPSNNTYRFYNCGGEEVCTYPRTGSSPGRSTRCNEEVILASEDYTAIWIYEDPYPNETCPPGEPLEWDWIQDLIAASDRCVIGIIRQFDYNGATYFRVGSGQYCGIADFSTYYYNCKGELVCVDAMAYSSFSCDEDLRRAGWSGTNIWAYQPSIAQTCPEGMPKEWDWVQEKIDEMSTCGETEFLALEFNGIEELSNIIYFLSECDSLQNQFYDCQGNPICGEGSDPTLDWLCESLINVMEDYTPSFCPEGDDPLEWDWIRDLIIEYSDCEVRQIRQFEYNGKTYFKTIAKEPDFYDYPCDEFERGYFNCAGQLICDNYSEPECNPEMVAASNTYESIWFYRDGIPTATCPEGDPLQWDWIQEIIESPDVCTKGYIGQFDYEAEPYFLVGESPYCTVADHPTYYYNCVGDTVCSTGWVNTCAEEFHQAASNITTIWTYEPNIAQTCPEGEPEQWDWVQEKIDNMSACGETEVLDIVFRELNMIYFWNDCDSLKNQFYDCQGKLICGEGTDPSLDWLCNLSIRTIEDYITSFCPVGDPLQWNWLQEFIANSGCTIKEMRQFEYNSSTYIEVLHNANCIEDGGAVYYDCTGNSVCVNAAFVGNTCEPEFDAAADSATTIYTNPFDAVIYPEKTHTICVPVSLPPLLTVEDFGTTGAQDFLNTLTVEFVEEQIDVQQYFTSTVRVYQLSSSTGNGTYFITRHDVANQILETPYVAPPGTICEEDLWSHIKIGRDQYKIYADQNGTKGSIMSTCNTPSLVCSTADFGIDTKVSGQYNFWASTYFEFPDGSICESEAAPFYLDVEAKPTATLSTQNKTLNLGEGLSLMDVVSDNKSGYWTGENIIYLMTVTGDNVAYFSANESGAYKLYYTVNNDNCEQSYLLLIEVPTVGKAAQAQPSYKPIDAVFNMYPNPTSNKVFIDLPDEAIYQINVIDIKGKVIKQMETDLYNSNIEIDVSDLPKGMYLVELKNELNQMLQKLVVE